MPHPPQLSDLELVERSLENPDEYAHLVERYQAPLMRYIRRITNVTRPEAEDILQLVFLKAYENLNAFDKKLKFSSWIYRIAHNEVVSAWRRNGKNKEEVQLEDVEAKGLIKSALNLSEQIDTKILAQQVRKILNAIPEKYRTVLILRFIEDKDYAEISDILRKPGGTVAALLNRAKKIFQNKWQDLNLSYE